MGKLLFFEEPTLLFGHSQRVEDPRDGLTLFGPLDAGKPKGIRAAVIGTRSGVERFRKWHKSIQSPVFNFPHSVARPFYPGYEAAFCSEWHPNQLIEVIIDENMILNTIRIGDKHQRVFETVNVYLDAILTALREEDTHPDLWCVVIPDEVKKYCRPRSVVEASVRVQSSAALNPSYAKGLYSSPSLFPEENLQAEPYYYEVNFHNQLKARLLEHLCPVQVIRESTIAPNDFVTSRGKPKRDLGPMLSDIAWHISTAVFYKSGGRPWKIGGVRKGVCYIGLVFKFDERYGDPRSACCAAQMFLDSGDGVVFKGDVGPWFNPRKGDFHLSRQAARELVQKAISAYKAKTGQVPSELFIHGKVRFSDTEWKGFQEAADKATSIVGVRIDNARYFKGYTYLDRAILRGLAYIVDEQSAYLWTRGFIPRLLTYPGREVPRPLEVLVTHGEAKIETVLSDILALTKLNYNACRHSDGYPVTLKFANAVGEILTAGPMKAIAPLPFKFYI